MVNGSSKPVHSPDVQPVLLRSDDLANQVAGKDLAKPGLMFALY